jgi:hypothetical protein
MLHGYQLELVYEPVEHLTLSLSLVGNVDKCGEAE